MSLNNGDPRDKLAAMTWKEIGQELGISHTAAQQTFFKAMRKLRANPEVLKDCMELAEMLDGQRKDYEW